MSRSIDRVATELIAQLGAAATEDDLAHFRRDLLVVSSSLMLGSVKELMATLDANANRPHRRTMPGLERVRIPINDERGRALRHQEHAASGLSAKTEAKFLEEIDELHRSG